MRMPKIKSAKKALRQSVRRKAQNDRRSDVYKAAVKMVKKSIEAGDFLGAGKLIPRLYQSLDKAAKTNAIKKNKASRLKSRITAFVAKAGAKK